MAVSFVVGKELNLHKSDNKRSSQERRTTYIFNFENVYKDVSHISGRSLVRYRDRKWEPVSHHLVYEPCVQALDDRGLVFGGCDRMSHRMTYDYRREGGGR